MPLQPVARQSVSDAVFEQLQGEIVAGRMAPGEALPAERALTELLGVNRQAVREALKRLDQAGLVEISHGGATRVRDYRSSAGLDLLASLLVADGVIDARVARSIMEMRACIGPDAARLCALRAVSPLADHLEALVDAMAAAGDDLSELSRLDWAFWALVIDGADNIAYRLAFNSLRNSVQPDHALLHAVIGDELRDLDGHQSMADAIRDGNEAAAERAARTMLARGSTTAAALLAESTPAGRAASKTAQSAKAAKTSTRAGKRNR